VISILQCCANYALNFAPPECSKVSNKPIGIQMYTVTGSSDHSVAIYFATHRKPFQFHIIIIHACLHLWQQWLMVQFGFLSAYDLLDLYMYFKKVMQKDTIKYKTWQKSLFLNKQLGRHCFEFFFKIPVICFVHHLVMLESFKNQTWSQGHNMQGQGQELDLLGQEHDSRG